MNLYCLTACAAEILLTNLAERDFVTALELVQYSFTTAMHLVFHHPHSIERVVRTMRV